MIYEVFDEERPSYFQSYVLSAFLLVAVVSVAEKVPAWPPTPATVFLVVWFGMLFYWITKNASSQKQFSSNRLSVTPEAFRHSFRYAVAEVTFVEIPLSEIVEVRFFSDGPRRIEVIGTSDYDLCFLPPSVDLARLAAAFRAGNPNVIVRSDAE